MRGVVWAFLLDMRTSFPSEPDRPHPPRFSLELAGFYPCLFFSPYDPESFSCEGQDYGYYADVASGCEVSFLASFKISLQILNFFLSSDPPHLLF